MLGAYRGRKRCAASCSYLFHRSCWTVGDYCYLQDLFVCRKRAQARRGRALIAAVEERARASGREPRLLADARRPIADARALYDKLAERSGFIQYRKLF